MSNWVIGENVPWSVSWTGEGSYELQPSRSYPDYVDLVQVERQGEGMPRFAALHAVRHRRGMEEHLCHVRGRRTVARDRYIFPVESGGFVTIGDGSQRYAGTVPAVHLACGKRARLLCPHLSHSAAIPVAYPSEESLVLPRPDIPEGMRELAKTLPRQLRVVFSCMRVYGPGFSARVQKLKQQRQAEP